MALIPKKTSFVIFCLLQSPDKLMDNDPEFFHRFTIVIGVQLPERYEMYYISSHTSSHLCTKFVTLKG